MQDPVEQFLNADFAGRAPLALRQAVFTQTTRVLRRRRLRRRLAWTGAMAACFVAGMATMFIWPREHVQERSPIPQAKQDLPAKQPDKPAAPPTVPEALSLVDLEWRAFDSRANRAALFFEVAQRYFEEQKDFGAALRCYRQALDAAPKEELAIRPDDNWLVMALKEARQKENNDAVINP